ncbi:sensor histidine kinase [Homoserinimonas sp. OAct 916]|uniref:sensor histidine kinase n=1 Tax=Homoserinimonas sp. OAct 916 TaxID=2211450 RepID=UPI0013003EAE|nr:sensor histidine kinase [Homoserinimonas sp. OAct 916]
MSAPTPATGQVADRSESPSARVWAVAVWLFIGVAAVTFLASLPAAWDARRQAAQALSASMPGDLYVAVGLVLATIFAGTCLVAATMLCRLPGLGRAAAFVLAGLAVGFPQTVPHLAAHWSPAAPAAVVLESAGVLALILFLLVFPRGRFTAGWTPGLLLPAAVVTISPFIQQLGQSEVVPGWLVAASWLSLLAGLPAAVFVNIRSADDRTRARRLGLVLVLAVVVSIAALLAAGWVQAAAWGRPGSAADLVTQFLVVAAFQFLAVSITSAVVSSTWLDARGVFGTVFTSGYLALVAVAVLVAVSQLADGFGGALGTGVGVLVPVVTVAVIATVVHPVFLVLRPPVVRLVYGRDAAPAEFVARLLQRMRSSGTPHAQLEHALREVRSALGNDVLRVDALGAGGLGTDTLSADTLSADTLSADLLGVTDDGAWVTSAVDRDTSPLAPVVDALQVLQTLRLAEQREVRGRAATAQAVEDERVRLRNELHDGLGPTVGAAILKLQASANLAARRPGEARSLVDEAQADLRGLVDQIRTIVRGLRPPLLDELGICGALQHLVRRQESSGPTVDLQTEGVDETLPAAVETAVFRIVAEALENVRRHAEASTAVVQLAVVQLGPVGGAGLGQREVVLTIRDDGSGFGPGVAQPCEGVGLSSMRQRAEALGGTFSVSGSEDGAIIRVQLPVEGPLRPAGRALAVGSDIDISPGGADEAALAVDRG